MLNDTDDPVDFSKGWLPPAPGAKPYPLRLADALDAFKAAQYDMAHKTDAVTWWNQSGRFFGEKAPEVRQFMLDPNNYELQPNSLNRAAGASLRETYLPPAPDFTDLKW